MLATIGSYGRETLNILENFLNLGSRNLNLDLQYIFFQLGASKNTEPKMLKTYEMVAFHSLFFLSILELGIQYS